MTVSGTGTGVAVLVLVYAASPASDLNIVGNSWVDREFSDQPVLSLTQAEDFLNTSCRPRGPDGLQIFAVQSGHDSPWHLHIWCRQDRAREIHWTLAMETFGRGDFASVIGPALAAGHTIVGPFRFGPTGERDSLLMIRWSATATTPTTAPAAVPAPASER